VSSLLTCKILVQREQEADGLDAYDSEQGPVFFLVKTAVTITESDYQYFGKDCCINISIREVVLMFLEHHK
jgi:hypothetical protein